MNSLETRWDGLFTDPLRPVFQLFDADHPLDFYIGKSVDQRRLLLLLTHEEPPMIRDMRAIRINTFRREDGKWSLLLELENISLSPMFSLLCEDLIESSRAVCSLPEKSLSFVLKRLSYWRLLLERGKPNLLTEPEIRGLCGELLFLECLVNYLGRNEAVTAWVGPNRADQDFQIPEIAWEIKTVRPSALAINISSELQLLRSTRAIQLVVFELADAVVGQVGAFTLNTLVDRIRDLLAEDHDVSELFDQQLAMAGYVPQREYEMPVLVGRSLTVFDVNADFPSLTRDRIASGISNVTYELLLSACEAFRIESHPFL